MLKSLTRPTTNTGQVWFAAPNRFRWEIGHPPQNNRSPQAQQFMLIYPRLKRVEYCALDSKEAAQWKIRWL